MWQWLITTEIVEVTKMARKRTMQPVNPIHPGEMLLEEFLLPAGKTQTAFAREVGWTRARLNEFIKGKRGVTAEAALDLAEALGTSPRLWMNLQATFDLDEASKKRRAA
jgi:addiction module HigA family antidote